MIIKQTWKVRFSSGGTIEWNVVANSATDAISLVLLDRPGSTIYAVEIGESVYLAAK